MARMTKNEINEKIRKLRLELFELHQAYATALYFEQMPEYDPLYTYCYSTLNFKITPSQQSVDDWVRAIIKHMATRKPGHGGAVTDARLVSIPSDLTGSKLDLWLNYEREKLKALAEKKYKSYQARLNSQKKRKKKS